MQVHVWFPHNSSVSNEGAHGKVESFTKDLSRLGKGRGNIGSPFGFGRPPGISMQDWSGSIVDSVKAYASPIGCGERAIAPRVIFAQGQPVKPREVGQPAPRSTSFMQTRSSCTRTFEALVSIASVQTELLSTCCVEAQTGVIEIREVGVQGNLDAVSVILSRGDSDALLISASQASVNCVVAEFNQQQSDRVLQEAHQKLGGFRLAGQREIAEFQRICDGLRALSSTVDAWRAKQVSTTMHSKRHQLEHVIGFVGALAKQFNGVTEFNSWVLDSHKARDRVRKASADLMDLENALAKEARGWFDTPDELRWLESLTSLAVAQQQRLVQVTEDAVIVTTKFGVPNVKELTA